MIPLWKCGANFFFNKNSQCWRKSILKEGMKENESTQKYEWEVWEGKTARKQGGETGSRKVGGKKGEGKEGEFVLKF